MQSLTAALGCAVVLSLSATGCALTSHETMPANLGVPRRSADMLAVIDVPGTVEVETVVAADWKVDRSGLINLDHPRAKEAHLEDVEEPIQIYFHALRHPQQGLFIVDTGVEKALRDAPEEAALRGLIASFAGTDKLVVKTPLSEWLSAQKAPLRGVFFTHLHIDHLTGLPDVPRGTPLFAGADEADEIGFMNMFVRSTTDRSFEGQSPLEEWDFAPDPDGRFDGVLDVFGDGQVWALSVPGHTIGSTAYVARSPSGPVLMTGDTCHTAWGWEHDVEPGSFTADHRKNAQSLERLRTLAKEHPKMRVLLGHQRLADAGK